MQKIFERIRKFMRNLCRERGLLPRDGNNSKEKYDWISTYIAAAAEEAVEIRVNN